MSYVSQEQQPVQSLHAVQKESMNQDHSPSVYRPSTEERVPPLPPRQQLEIGNAQSQNFPPPPERCENGVAGIDDPSDPVHYTRNPHRLVAYLVPFPKPTINGVRADAVPTRFLIYTPPPPPLRAPEEGEKEGKVHKVQRKWQDEVRAAKTMDVKTMSWKGLKGKATKGINTAMGHTKSSSLDFLTRIGDDGDDKHSEDVSADGANDHKTVGLEAMCLVYPSSLSIPEDKLKQEFVDTMMRSKSRAQKDAILATGLLPVSAAIDICATLVWPFGGLLEIDSVWLYSSLRGAKASRSITKRLASSGATGDHDEDQLRLEFASSPQIDLLCQYLAARCHEKDAHLFPYVHAAPTETTVLEAIGWAPSQSGSEEKNWEDEQWETSEVKEDIKSIITKGAKEWAKWVKMFEKDPEKALKK